MVEQTERGEVQSKLRNPTLVNLLKDVKDVPRYMERLGSGIRFMSKGIRPLIAQEDERLFKDYPLSLFPYTTLPSFSSPLATTRSLTATAESNAARHQVIGILI
jgi:hypothetical protein